MAANSLGEERSPAQSRRLTPVRVAVVAALALVVIALLVVAFSGGSEYKYDLLFQNAGQLVPDNQVLVGGQPVGSVDGIDLTEDDLAEVHISVSQQLHEGTTATIRATSLSGVANHYVSVSPGPNNKPALDEGATLGLGSTTTPVDLDQFFNTFPKPVRRGLAQFIQGNAAIYSNRGPDANRTYRYFAPALNRTNAFVSELDADQHQLERFLVSSSKLATVVSSRGEQLSDAVSHANTAFGAIASENTALSNSLRLLPPVFRQSNTTFVNLRAALDDLETLVDTAKPATKNLAPFLANLRPVLSKAVPVFHNLRLTMARPGEANDTGELLAVLPGVQQLASKAFPHSEESIRDFQPNLNFIRAYTPDLFNGFAKVGQITGAYDGNGHYARISFADLNLFNYEGVTGRLNPIPPSQQYEAFGSSAGVKRRCPGAATQPAPDGSNPFTEPPFPGSGVTPSQCNPADVPPGP